LRRDDYSFEPKLTEPDPTLEADLCEFELQRKLAVDWLRDNDYITILGRLNKAKMHGALGKAVGELRRQESSLASGTVPAPSGRL